jgi:type I site-specific restriction endonuclease
MTNGQNESFARVEIDKTLRAAGWIVCDVSQANIHAARGVAIREFPLKPGYGCADYLLYLDGKAAGVIEAKKQGVTLTGVEIQSDKYTKGLPAGLPAWHSPLPFSYQSTGIETRFTNGLDPEPRPRNIFCLSQNRRSQSRWRSCSNAPLHLQGLVTSAGVLRRLLRPQPTRPRRSGGERNPQLLHSSGTTRLSTHDGHFRPA